MAYDIFISYRRKGAGAGVAGELQAKLENRGYKVFLDVDEISSGTFPEQIEHAIEGCKDFLLILAPDTLDRCVDKEDWVRREITKAEDTNKNFIGVMLPGFVMPEIEALPEPLQGLPSKQLFLWSHEYRTASFKKIEENLASAEVKKVKKRRKLTTAIIAVLVVLSLGVATMVRRPHEESVVEPRNSTVGPKTKTEPNSRIAEEFNEHVDNAKHLSEGLPTVAEFDDNFMVFIKNEELFHNLMEAITEYDSAIILKNEYQGQIIDSFDVEKLRNEALVLRSAYMKRILEDIDNLINAGWGQYANSDLQLARVLALTSDIPVLDSLALIVSNKK